MRTREITVEIIRHEKTGLLVALSDDMRGLLVHGDTVEEIEERLPKAIHDILEHETKGQARIIVEEVPVTAMPGFVSKVRRFNLAEAA